jgi:hypothetical protein
MEKTLEHGKSEEVWAKKDGSFRKMTASNSRISEN